MKQLLYYETNNSFVADQTSAGGDGTKVVSVYNGVAWTEDSGLTYYKDNITPKVTYNVTIHYVNYVLGKEFSTEVIPVLGYSGCAATQLFYAKKFDNLIPRITEINLTVSADTDYTFYYDIEDLRKIPLTFKVNQPGSIFWKRYQHFIDEPFDIPNRTIEYSKNGGAWTSITSAKDSAAPSISVVAGDIVQFRGDNDSYAQGWINNGQDFCTFSGTSCSFELVGNVMSLVDSVNYSEKTTLDNAETTSGRGTYFAFLGMFQWCTGLTNAKYLVLPAKKLTIACYCAMFSECEYLVEGPKELPGENFPSYCYMLMFSECTRLVKGPDILVKTDLYNYVSHTDAMGRMFRNCNSLNYIKCMLSDVYCYGTSKDWVYGVASSGTFVKNKDNNRWSFGANGIPNNWTVVNE